MSTKRKNQDDAPRFHDRKKVKIQEARQIVIQVPTHVADGRCRIPWITILPDTLKGSDRPPVSLDVERFADVNLVHSLGAHSLMLGQARSFEITAMQNSVVNAR